MKIHRENNIKLLAAQETAIKQKSLITLLFSTSGIIIAFSTLCVGIIGYKQITDINDAKKEIIQTKTNILIMKEDIEKIREDIDSYMQEKIDASLDKYYKKSVEQKIDYYFVHKQYKNDSNGFRLMDLKGAKHLSNQTLNYISKIVRGFLHNIVETGIKVEDFNDFKRIVFVISRLENNPILDKLFQDVIKDIEWVQMTTTPFLIENIYHAITRNYYLDNIDKYQVEISKIIDHDSKNHTKTQSISLLRDQSLPLKLKDKILKTIKDSKYNNEYLIQNFQYNEDISKALFESKHLDSFKMKKKNNTRVELQKGKIKINLDEKSYLNKLLLKN